ncbi:MAG: ABC transporter permease [Acidimicrobiales bacterium]
MPTLAEDDPKPLRVGVVGTLSPAGRDAIVAAGRLADVKLRLRDVAGSEEAEKALRVGDLDLAVLDGPSLVVDEPPNGTSRLSRLAVAVSRSVGLQDRLEDAGLTPEDAADALRAPPLPTRSLQPPEAKDGDDAAGVAFLGSLVLYVLLITYGSWIANSVVQEKASRVIEVLLAAVRPIDLLVGKVLGVGVVALGQGLVFAGAGIAAAFAVGSDNLPDGTALSIASALLWLLVGFGFYSFAYATAASLASRQEDAQSASMPLAVVLLLAYFAGAGAGEEPGAALVRVLSFFPPTAPIVMPARVAAGGVAAWEPLVSIAVMLVGTYGMARLAAHVFPRVALHSGARLKLRVALRTKAG